MTNPSFGARLARLPRPHRSNTAAMRLQRREYQAWLREHPQARAERKAMDALIAAGRCAVGGRVMVSCVCGWTGYAPGGRCMGCQGKV